MSDISEIRGYENRGESGFWRLLVHLTGNTVRIHTNSTHWTGKLANVESCYISLASTSSNGGCSARLVYFPIRQIRAVSDI